MRCVRIKLKIFTNHFYPENFKINDIAKYLANFYDVSVVTQTPNYSKGKFFEGYGLFEKTRESLEGLRVNRLPVIPRGKSSMTLALNYVSYILSSTIYSLLNREKVDCILTYVTSPIFISWAGLRVAKRNNAPHILYLLDLWPDSLFAILQIKNEKLRGFFEKICISIYKRCDLIIVSSEPFIDQLINYGIEKNKLVYIPQHASEIREIKKEFKDDDILKIVFTGNIGEAQGLDILVEVAMLLKEKEIDHVVFTIVGDGRYKPVLVSLVSDNDVENYFHFIDRVDASKIPGILEENDFAFLSLKDEAPFTYTLPAKLQGYMSEGMPVIGYVSGAAASVIEEAKCGYCVEPLSPLALTDLIIELKELSNELLQEMSFNGIKYSEKHFDKKKLFSQIRNIIDSTIKTG